MGHTQRTRVSKMDYYNLCLTCTYIFLLCLNIPVDCYVLHHRSRRQNGIAHHPIYWNESNQIFHADNNWHVKEVNLGDSISIKCPHKSFPGYEDAVNNQDLYYAIYLASESNYNTCAYNKDPQTKQLLRCDRPNGDDPHGLNINFVDFTPVPGVPEFHAGRTYYIYTMSTGAQSGLDNMNTAQSACHRRNMKVTFVVRGAAPPSSSPASVPRTPSTSTTTTTSPPRVDPTTTTPATKSTTTKKVVPKSTKKIPTGGGDGNENNTEGKGDPGKQTSGQSSVTMHSHLLLILACCVLHLFLLLRT